MSSNVCWMCGPNEVRIGEDVNDQGRSRNGDLKKGNSQSV